MVTDCRIKKKYDTVTSTSANFKRIRDGRATVGDFVSKTLIPPRSSTLESSHDSQSVPAADILQQLDRILAHPLFQKSQRLSSLLRYVVERTLAGEADSLKESVIGAELFGRGNLFDSQTDNIVRVNANRLRSRLAEYYHRSGQGDMVGIDLPKGRYVPVFFHSQAVPHGPISHSAAPARTSVGRQHELDRIRAAFNTASGGTGLMVAVSGEAGLGKTTIVEDFLAEVETATPSAWIGRGRCSERLANSDAFVPIFECLDDLTRGEPGVQAAQVLSEAAPAWFSQIAAERGHARGVPVSNASHERMRREFVRFFEALSAIRPVVVFLDDLHWCDESTCDLLAYLGVRMKDIRILILATYRPAQLTAVHPFQSVRLPLVRKGTCQEIPLEFLTTLDIECYLHRRFPANRFSSEFVSVVHERTEGNPLFMRDMLSFLVDKQILVDRDGYWQAGQDVAEIRKVIPAGTQNMILLQVEQFSDVDRKILQCAAVQGVEFDSAVISQALSMDLGEVEDRLHALERVHRFVNYAGEREFPDRTFSLRYRFVHVFYQNALFADLAPSRRAAHSLAVARSLINFTGATGRAMAAEVALLFEAGRDRERASEQFLRAARYAASVFAYPEAVAHCSRGLRALLSLPESRDRDARELEFSLTLGLAQMATCGYAAPEVETTYRRSWELCLRLHETKRYVRVLWGVHTCLINAGKLVPALELAKEMRQVADTSGVTASIVESLHALGTTLAFMGDVAGAREALERIRTFLSPIDQHQFRGSLYVLDTGVTSMSMLARVLARMDLFDEALEMAVTSVQLAKELAHPPSLAYGTFWVGWVRHARGEHFEACVQLETAMSLTRMHGMPHVLEWGRLVRGSSLAHLGRVAEGIADMRKSLDNQLSMRSLLERPYCLTLLAEALLSANAAEEALALCDEAINIAQETQGRSYESETHRIRARSLLAIQATHGQAAGSC
jgi:tetratricopeptide (TPR) repeat protein